MTIEDFEKVPISEAIKIPNESGCYNLLLNRYWAVTDDGCILFYRGYSPQCNSVEAITQHLITGTHHPAKHVLFLPVVYRVHRCEV